MGQAGIGKGQRGYGEGRGQEGVGRVLHDQVPSLYLFRKGCSVNEYVMIVNSRVVEEQPAGRGGRRWGALGEHRDLTARLWGVGVGGGWVGGGRGYRKRMRGYKNKSHAPRNSSFLTVIVPSGLLLLCFLFPLTLIVCRLPEEEKNVCQQFARWLMPVDLKSVLLVCLFVLCVSETRSKQTKG